LASKKIQGKPTRMEICPRHGQAKQNKEQGRRLTEIQRFRDKIGVRAKRFYERDFTANVISKHM
jgi:hypothetical protein